MKQVVNHNIDELLAKFLAGEATPAEKKEALTWVDISEDNRQYFFQFSLLWSEVNPSNIADAVDENKAWNKFEQTTPSSQKIINIKWIRLIAAAAILISTGIWVAYLFNNAFNNNNAQIVSSSFDHVKTDTLPDKSVITLNKKATLTYPVAFTGNERNVTLKGEAFFEVSPDKAKPFIIDAGNTTIKVVGTSFNIKSIDSIIEVIVSSGIVQVKRGDEMIELKKGEQTIVRVADNQPLKKTSSTDKLFNYYVSKTFVCDNTPLWKLAEKLNEAYNINISIPNKETRALPLTVTFHEESLDTIFEVLSQTFMLKVTKNGNNIVLQ